MEVFSIWNCFLSGGMVGEGAAHWGGSPLRLSSPDNLVCIGHNCNKYVFKYLTQILIYDSLISNLLMRGVEG